MKKRTWSATALVCALLLLLSSASLAKSSISESKDPTVGARVGARVPNPLPMTGTDPGDDDTPDRGGEGDVQVPVNASNGAVVRAEGSSSRSLKVWWASFRLQLSTVLRVWK